MAKSTKRIAVTGEVGPNYWHVDDMPWEDIEGRTGHQFSETDREEIRAIASQALAQYDIAVDSPRVSEVEALQNEIIQHSKAIVAIAKKYRTPEGLPLIKGRELMNSRNEAVFLGLALSSNDPSFSLTKQLIDAAAACEDLVTDLSKIRIGEHETALSPDVVLLAYFVGLSVQRADQKPARTRDKMATSNNPTAFEFHRWGLHLSPKTGNLPLLASAVFQRPVSKGQIEHAFTVARRLRVRTHSQ